MSESASPTRNTTWLIATTFVLVLLVAYVGGYFWLGKHESGSTRPGVVEHFRMYRASTLQVCYRPLAWCECRIRGETVNLSGPTGLGSIDDGDIFDPP